MIANRRVAIGLALVVVGAWTGCRPTEIATPLVAVQTAALKHERVSSEMRFTATVRERHRVELSFKVPGTVVSFLQVSESDGVLRDAHEGDVVAPDSKTPLAHLDDSDYLRRQSMAQERLAQSQAKERASVATVTAIEANYGRIKSLRESGSVAQQTYDDMLAKKLASEAELDASRREVSAATVALQQADDDLRNCALSAPIPKATISRKYIEKNERVAAGQPVMQVMDVSQLRVAFGVPDTKIAQFRLGQVVSVTADAFRSERFSGRVTKILPAADLKTRTIEVEVTIEEPRQLKPGMVVTILLGHEDRMLLVPMTAIQRGAGKDELSVFTLVEENGQKVARRRRIAIDGVYDNRIRLIESSPTEIRPGDLVVVTGAFRLTDGQAVRVLDVQEPVLRIGTGD